MLSAASPTAAATTTSFTRATVLLGQWPPGSRLSLRPAACRFLSRPLSSNSSRTTEIRFGAAIPRRTWLPRTARTVIRVLPSIIIVSKEGLFAEVIEHAFSGHLEGDRSTLADGLARMMVYGRPDKANDRQIPLLLLLHSATEPRAAELLRASSERNMLRFLAKTMGGPDADIRAAMAIAQCVGFKILDQMLRPRALAKAQRETLVALLSKSLAVCIA
jgi:Tetracyclin repressor-like, C-terminal domain